MNLHILDWVMIAVYLAITTVIAVAFSKKAGKSLGDFFLGGRNLPWYIAGISMVATTFAADTPLAVTELVARQGISGNWLWWNMMIGGMLTTFFFARLWRRANILTEVEFIQLRYSGVQSHVLRGFKAIYLGFFMNILVLGWVNLALITILEVFFEVPKSTVIWYVAGAMALVAIYSALSGLKGVVITDVIQFGIAMTGSILLAVIILHSNEIGGISGLKTKLADQSAVFSFFPRISSAGGAAKVFVISAGAFLAYIGFQWWASWYPGAEPGGGGYIAQRMMSTKNEKHSVFATLFFQVAHYCLRPWPWIIVALCTLVLYPEIAASDPKQGYVMAMKDDFLPIGLKGLLLVAFLAAYMSTISTQLNWGASYLVNDFYKPFLRPPGSLKKGQDENRFYVGVSRAITIILMLASLAVTTQIKSISGVWLFILECGAGLGLVLILRWFWWRINSWSEIAATITPFFVYGFLKYAVLPYFFLKYLGTTGLKGILVLDQSGWETIVSMRDQTLGFPNSYFITIGITTVVWLAVTFLTRPEPMTKLVAFYKLIRPGGMWKKVRMEAGMSKPESQTLKLLGCWLSSIVFTYSALFAIGKLIFHEWVWAGIYFGVVLLSGLVLYALLTRTRIFDLPEE